MKKKLLFIIVLLLILCGCNGKKIEEKKKVEIDNYKIEYITTANKYILETKDNKINITKYDNIVCVKAPCNPIRDKEYNIELKEEYKTFIEDLFKDKDTKEISITEDNLNYEQLKIMYSILNEELPKLTYYIVPDNNYYMKEYKERGYYLETERKNITVASGMRYSGGYTISIEKVDVVDNDITIYVKETRPGANDIVTEAITYPKATMSISRIPSKIKVINIETNEEFSKQEFIQTK